MSLHHLIEQKIKGHNPPCKECFDSTSEKRFFIFDPPQLTGGERAKLLMTEDPISANKLEVDNHKEHVVEFVALDNCLLPKSIKKCDCVLAKFANNQRHIIWVELKMETKNTNINTVKKIIQGDTDSNGIDTGAIGQIRQARNYLHEKGVLYQNDKHKGHIALPKSVQNARGMSQSLQELQRKLQKDPKIKMTITIGPKLDL
jgi:hypothetical protein